MSETEGPRSGLKKIKTKLLLGLASLGLAAGAVTVGVAATGGFSPTTIDRQGIELSGLSEQEQQLVTQLDQINGSILKLQEGADYQQKIYQLAFNRRKIIIDLMNHPATARKVIDITGQSHGLNPAAREKLNTVITTDKPSDQLPPVLRIEKDDLIEQKVDNWTGFVYKEMEQPGTGSKPNNYGFQRQIGGEDANYYRILVADQPKPITPGPNEIVSGFAVASILLPDIDPDIEAVHPINPIKN